VCEREREIWMQHYALHCTTHLVCVDIFAQEHA
jgi:hypothetical protein